MKVIKKNDHDLDCNICWENMDGGYILITRIHSLQPPIFWSMFEEVVHNTN